MLGAVIGDIVGSIYEKKGESAASRAMIGAGGTINHHLALGGDRALIKVSGRCGSKATGSVWPARFRCGRYPAAGSQISD